MKSGEDQAKSIRYISERGFHEKSWEIAFAEIQISEPSIISEIVMSTAGKLSCTHGKVFCFNL